MKPPSHHYLLGWELDEGVEGVDCTPTLSHASISSESTASARIETALEVAIDRGLAGGSFVERLECSPDGKPRARTRYVGQPRRGRQEHAQLDDQDRREALRAIEEGMRGLARYRSRKVKALPRVQREDIRTAAVECLYRAQRWLDEIAERNTPGHKPDD